MSDTALALKEEVRLIGFDDMPIKELLEKKESEIRQILPPTLDFGHYIRSINTYLYKHPKLNECTRESLFVACIEAAEVGLDFNATKGWAYIVPRWNKKTGAMEACFQPGFKGYIELMYRSGKVSHAETHIVYSGDDFHVHYGTNPRIDHAMQIDPSKRGDIIGAYAVVWFKDSSQPLTEYMTKDEIDKISESSKLEYLWKTQYGEMARKTVVNRVSKYVPISPELSKLIEYDNRYTELRKEGAAASAESALDDRIKRMEEAEAQVVNEPEQSGESQQEPAESGDDALMPVERFIRDACLNDDQAYQVIKRLYGKAKADDMVNITDAEANHLITYARAESEKQESLF